MDGSEIIKLQDGLFIVNTDNAGTFCTIPAANAKYTVCKQSAGPFRRAKITFGIPDLQTPATTNYPTLAVVKGSGSTGAVGYEFVDFAKGAIAIWNVYAKITNTTTASWAPTSPVMSVGTAVVGANSATLTGTAADIIPSTALTISSQASTFNPTPLTLSTLSTITDSTTGVASTTFAAITGSASYASADITAIKNALAQIALSLNTGTRPLILDGTGTAKKFYLNFACNSDPSTGKTVVPAGFIDIWYSFFAGT